MDVKQEHRASKRCIHCLAYVPHGGIVVRVRGFDTKTLPWDEGIGALVVTIGDEGAYGHGVNGGHNNPSVGLKLGSV